MDEPSRWWALDLAVGILLADLAGAAIYLGAPAVVRIPLALLLVLVLPGYAVTAALYPARNPPGIELSNLDDDGGGLLNPLPSDYELGDAERLVLSVTLSAAIVPAVAAVVNFAAGTIALEPVLLGVVGTTIGLAVLAFFRRLGLPPGRRHSVLLSSLAAVPRPFKHTSRLHRDSTRVGPFNLVAVVGLLLLVSSVAYALAAPPQPEGFTEFYIDEPGLVGTGTTPVAAESGGSRRVTVGITNHEHRAVRYTAVALAESGGDGALRRVVTDRATVTVADGQTRRVDLSILPTSDDPDPRFRFLLYRGEAPANPSPESAYRSLRLMADASSSQADRVGAP